MMGDGVDRGLTGRAINEVYRAIALQSIENGGRYRFSTSFSCMQIYNEQARTWLAVMPPPAPHLPRGRPPAAPASPTVSTLLEPSSSGARHCDARVSLS